MCLDYIRLNKVCPKDLYPLIRIEHLVDAGHERLSFPNVIFGYHQIFMAKFDKEKMSFIIYFRTYYYMAIYLV